MEMAQTSLMPVGNVPADTAYTMQVLEEALRQPQTETTLWALYGQLLSQQGASAEAIFSVYEEMLKIAPEDLDARLGYLRTLLMNEKFERASTLCEEGCRYHPDQIVFAFYGALSLMQLGDDDAAANML